MAKSAIVTTQKRTPIDVLISTKQAAQTKPEQRLSSAYDAAVETPVLDNAVKQGSKQAFSPASSLEEFMGIVPYTDENTIAENEWKRMGVDNAKDYAKIRTDYTSRGLKSGLVGAARDTVNYMGNTVQQGNQRFQRESAVENAVANAMASGNTGGKTYEELYNQYQKEFQDKFKEEPLRKTVDWGEAYDQESERIAQELGVNEEARKDYQFNQALGRMAPAIAVSMTGNLAGAGLTALGAGEAAKGAYTIGRILSSASTFTSAAGGAYEEAKAHGIDDDQAMTYAATVGAIELATEALSSGLGKVGGKKIGTGGVTDDFVEALAKKASSDPNVQNAIIYVGGVLGEGFEEWLSEWGDYLANKALVKYDDRTLKDVWGDSKESFYQGAMMSSLLNITQLMQKGVSPKDAIRQGVDETAAEAGIAPTEQVSPAAQAMANAATQNSVQETAPTQTEISPAARTMADVLTGKNAEAALPSTEYSAVTENVAARKASDIASRAKASMQQIRQFIRNALSQNNDFQYIKIDDVSPELASVLNANGIQADGYSHVFKDNDIRHIENRHGEKSGAKYPVTEATLSKIARAIENYDVLYQGYDTKSGNPAVVYEYHDGNRTFYVEEVLEDGVLSSKQAVIVGENSKPSFLKKYKKIADKVSDTDVAAQGRATGQSPLGNHVQDADTNVSNLEASASTSIIPAQSQNVNTESVETRLSQTAETVRDAGITPDAVKQDINTGIENGKYRYIPESNADAVASARASIKENGYDSVLRSWTAEVARGKTSNDLFATGAVLYNEAIQSGNTKLALDILTDYQMLGTNTAQGLQAASIIKNLTPDGQLYIMQQDVKKLNDSRSETAKRKLPEGYKIDPELADAFINAKDDAARDAAVTAIQQDIASQIPASFAEKWRALRYLNMLGNVKTQVRNLLGNTAMMGLTGAKNTMLTGVEYLVNKLSGGKYERNTAFGVRDYLDAAKKYYSTVNDYVNGDSKYMESNLNDSFSRGIQDARKIFGVKPLEAYCKATQWAMTQGDVLFIRPQFARSLSGYLKARGMDANTFAQIVNGDIQATTEQQNLIHSATEYAAREAQEATFHDSNAISDAVSKVGKGWPAPVRAIFEGILPFRKTPANVLMRAEEYSPLGIVNTAVNAYQAAKGLNGKTAADVINSFSKTATGTSLFALGALLAKAGLARGAEDDEEQAAFDKMQGKQDFSVVLPDGSSYTIDWMSPAAVPFFMGVAFSDAMSDGEITIGEFLKAIDTLTEPMIDMSMLQGVNDALDQIKYADNALVNFALNQMVNYVSQGIGNSLFGQIERITEKNRETTYTESDTPEGRTLERTLGKVLNKIPGLEYNQVEYVDAWGRTQSNGSVVERAFSNLLSPGYIGKNRSTEVDSELQRLYDAGQTNVFPSRIAMSQTVNTYNNQGKKLEERSLTKDEYVQYQKVMGQTSLELVKDLMKSPVYKGMSDEAKADAISEIYGYAKRMAAMAVEPSAKYGEKTDVSKLSNPAAYYATNASFNTASKDSENRNYTELDSLTSSFNRLPKDVRDAVTDGNAGFAKLLDAKENGYTARQYYDVYDTVKALAPAAGYTNVATWQKIDAVCSMNVSDKEKDYFVGNYFTDGAYKRYQTAREAGYSPYSVSVAYQTYQLSEGVDKNGDGKVDSGTKKAAFISAMMAQGASKSSAEWLYKLFNSNK